MSERCNWLRGALTDENGHWDIAYIGMGALVLTVLGSIPTILAMVAGALIAGRTFDPTPTGLAIGAVCGGFATALGALAGYMAATRPPKGSA